MKAAYRQIAPANALLAFLLALSLLFTQGIGLHHRISHAWIEPGHHTHSAPQEMQADKGHEGIGHSCLVFDAATLGTLLQGADCTPLPASYSERFVPAFRFISWQAALLKRFSSRAPPLV